MSEPLWGVLELTLQTFFKNKDYEGAYRIVDDFIHSYIYAIPLIKEREKLFKRLRILIKNLMIVASYE